MRLLALPALAFLVFAIPQAAQAADYPVELKNSDYTFVDAEGMLNIVGVVNNKGYMPISVTMGLDIIDPDGKTTTLQEGLYGRVIFPGKGAPFKFKVQEEMQVAGKPYVANVEQVNRPFFDTLVMNYTNMAVGEGRSLIGTVRNTGPFEVHNITVYASVHREDSVNVDSVRSNVIELLAPGEEATFTASPDPAVKAGVYYYSCAGFDPDAPITTIPTGDGGFIAYDLQAVAKVSSFRYDNDTDSISFGVTPYNPKGGPVALKIPQVHQNQTLTVLQDGQIDGTASVKMDGRTVSIDMFVLPGDHEVQLQGVRTIPEFPFAALGLAAVIAAALAVTRFKAAFKVS